MLIPYTDRPWIVWSRVLTNDRSLPFKWILPESEGKLSFISRTYGRLWIIFNEPLMTLLVRIVVYGFGRSVVGDTVWYEKQRAVEYVELEDEPLSTYAAEQLLEWYALILCMFVTLPLVHNLEIAWYWNVYSLDYKSHNYYYDPLWRTVRWHIICIF